MPYYVYILRSERTGRYYVGSSGAPVKRLRDHNTTTKGFTARHRPWKMVYRKDLKTKSAAQAAERRIKGWKSRVMIERLIDGRSSLE